MDTKNKMAMAGSGLVAVGIGLSLVGTALIAPAVFAWAARLAEKGAEGLAGSFERTSRRVGTVAGTLQRSFREAKKAGIAEIHRDRPNQRNIVA